MINKFDQEIEKLQQKIQEVRQKEKDYLDDLALTLGSDLIKLIPKEDMPKNKKEQKVLSEFLCGLYQDHLDKQIKETETITEEAETITEPDLANQPLTNDPDTNQENL